MQLQRDIIEKLASINYTRDSGSIYKIIIFVYVCRRRESRSIIHEKKEKEKEKSPIFLSRLTEARSISRWTPEAPGTSSHLSGDYDAETFALPARGPRKRKTKPVTINLLVNCSEGRGPPAQLGIEIELSKVLCGGIRKLVFSSPPFSFASLFALMCIYNFVSHHAGNFE